jgi:hypothetical protein
MEDTKTIKNLNDIEPKEYEGYMKYKKLIEFRLMDEKELIILNNINLFRIISVLKTIKNILIFFTILIVLTLLSQIIFILFYYN